MFTGIVEELGSLAAFEDLGEAARLTLSGPLVAKDAAPGDPIAVSGVRRTVERTTVGRVAVGATLNLGGDVVANYVVHLVRWCGWDARTRSRRSGRGGRSSSWTPRTGRSRAA